MSVLYKRGNKIRIGFPFALSGGGPSLFVKRLKRSIVKQNLAQVMSFINPFTHVNLFSNLARNIYGRPYIFRVDGIYFDCKETHGPNVLRNEPIFGGINNAAGVIFQSDFSKKLIVNFYGNIDCPNIVINNGVNLSTFSPGGCNKRDTLGIKKNDLVFVTSAKWRAHKRLRDIINVFLEYKGTSGKTCYLIILGNDGMVKKHPSVYNIGFISPNELPSWYRTGDIFLFFSWLDNCPTSVIEAIACGLPVVCTNQGGTRELVEITKGGIVVETDNAFAYKLVDLYNPPTPNYCKIRAAIDRVVQNLDFYVQNIDRSHVDIDNVAKKYVGFIKKVFSSTC